VGRDLDSVGKAPVEHEEGDLGLSCSMACLPGLRTSKPGGVAARRHLERLVAAFFLGGVFVAVELLAALLLHASVLAADAGHFVADLASIAIALGAVWLQQRSGFGGWTFGFERAEVISGVLNGSVLAVVGLGAVGDGVLQLLHPHRFDGGGVAAIGLGSLFINALLLALVGRPRENLSLAALSSHLKGDLLGSLVAINAGLLMAATGGSWIGGTATLLEGVVLFGLAKRPLVATLRVLMEAAPASVDLDAVALHILTAEHVKGVHDLHVWSVSSELSAASAHVVIDEECFRDGHAPEILSLLQNCLAEHFSLHHVSLQLEPAITD